MFDMAKAGYENGYPDDIKQRGGIVEFFFHLDLGHCVLCVSI